MSDPRPMPRHILVAGGGATSVLAAVALRRALPATQVTVLVTPPEPAAFADRASSALPFSVRLLERLGLAEPAIVNRCGGSHRLMMRYLGWSEEGRQGTAAHGAAIDPALQTGFMRDWGGGGRGADTAAPPGSLAEVLADAGRYAPAGATGTPGPLDEVDHALRWNADALRDLAISQAHALGVQHRQGQAGAVRLDAAGHAAAVEVKGTGEIAADLFVDCTGPAALLLAQMPGAQRIDWSAMLPVRQVLYGQPGAPMVALEDRLSITPAGWLHELAGRDGLQRTLGLAKGAGEQDVLAAIGGEPMASVSFIPGRARESWLGNVVALGDAAALFEPLGNFNADFAHRQLDLLLEMLPGTDVTAQERGEFNRRTALMADGTRDIVAAHYTPARAAALFGPLERSDELSLALDQFTRRGRSPYFEEWPLVEQERAALFGALGIARGTPSIEHQRDEQAERQFAAKAEAALNATPPYPQWLASVISASQEPAGG